MGDNSQNLAIRPKAAEETTLSGQSAPGLVTFGQDARKDLFTLMNPSYRNLNHGMPPMTHPLPHLPPPLNTD